MRVVLALFAGFAVACSGGGGPWRFQEGDPASVGMDAARLEESRTYAFGDGMFTQGVVIARRGVVVAEWYDLGADVTSPGASWSMGKSFTSALIGIALERGEIPSIDEPMTTYFPEWAGTNKASITLRDVLEMSSGLAWNESYDPEDLVSSDVAQMVTSEEPSHVALVADNEVAHPPGTFFNYSSGDTMLLSRVLSVATGMAAGDYAALHLFPALGLDEETAGWWKDKQGDTLTYCCVDMPSRGFAAFGELYRQRGLLGEDQVVPAAWVDATLTPSRSYEGYGLQWWLIGRTDDGIPEDTFAALGHDGQFIYVIPSLELVVVRNGEYDPYSGAKVADPSLFVRYPSDGLIGGRGTRPPDHWDDADFLGPIVASIQ